MNIFIQSIMLIGMMAGDLRPMPSLLLADPPLELSTENLSKKWSLDHYSVFFYREEPSSEEAEDYLQLNKDLTFGSVENGKYEEGQWKLNPAQRKIHLSKDSEVGELIFKVHKLGQRELILIIDDPNDLEAQFLHIHFTTN